jgi:hypothetical protein
LKGGKEVAKVWRSEGDVKTAVIWEQKRKAEAGVRP